MQIACAVALPTLVVSLFLFPAYHAFPPAPLHRPFWAQASDHYFYVMYSFVVVGAATVYEWDLLFPDILDIFVLSVLPIPSRRLFFARVLALAIFLCLVQIGTSILGNLFFPMVAEQFNFVRHIFSHFIAVTMSGMFAAANLSLDSRNSSQYRRRTNLPPHNSPNPGRIHHAAVRHFALVPSDSRIVASSSHLGQRDHSILSPFLVSRHLRDPSLRIISPRHLSHPRPQLAATHSSLCSPALS